MIIATHVHQDMHKQTDGSNANANVIYICRVSGRSVHPTREFNIICVPIVYFTLYTHCTARTPRHADAKQWDLSTHVYVPLAKGFLPQLHIKRCVRMCVKWWISNTKHYEMHIRFSRFDWKWCSFGEALENPSIRMCGSIELALSTQCYFYSIWFSPFRCRFRTEFWFDHDFK